MAKGGSQMVWSYANYAGGGMYEPDDDGRKADVPDVDLTHLVESRMPRKWHVRFGERDDADQTEQSSSTGGALPTLCASPRYLRAHPCSFSHDAEEEADV